MIVTGRARWIIVLALAVMGIGLMRQNVFLVRFSVACLIWIGLEWLAFRFRVDVLLRQARTQRELRSHEGPLRVLWETRSVDVLTRVQLPQTWSWIPCVRATVHDLLPTSVDLQSGDAEQSFWLGEDCDTQLAYRVCPHSPGTVRFMGLRLILRDLHGFFYAERFLPHPQTFRVLPLAVNRGTIATARKISNVLAPPGEHLMSKPGVGSELMEIRAYQPGDSPRAIAWKVSARRNEIMSKQFESEVPVRCQLFVDMSRAVRLGYPGPCLGGRLVSLAATIATVLAAHRDPVGLSVFDGVRFNISKASANKKSILRMIDRLCQSLDCPVEPVASTSRELIRSGYDIARIRYPQAVEYARTSLASLIPSRPSWRMRLRLSAILCNHYRLGTAAMGELVENDLVMSAWLQRFHAEHGVPYAGSLFDAQGNYLFDDRAKIDHLAKLLHRAAVRGRDNELFVIMAELTDSEYDLRPLQKAIHFAKARHHRVMLLLAWPPKMPIPSQQLRFDYLLDQPAGSTEFLVERRQQETAFLHLRKELGRLRVPVVAAADQLATSMILRELELVRAGRTVA